MNGTYQGNIVNIEAKRIFFGEIVVTEGIIAHIITLGPERKGQHYILPGFIDSHVHIESSMLVPSEFAKLAVVHGTTGTISDPHEIANVCGVAGVHYMIENGKTVPFKFHFGAPSCVPATSFETAGATLNVKDVEKLLASDDIYYLSEMMNFPGVLHNDDIVTAKIAAAKKAGKPIDGHAPGLFGTDAEKYFKAGITTDHECFTEAEARGKLALGMKILIREGSAAKNFEALISLLSEFPDHMMFCSDDKHPDSLTEGHINLLCKRAVAKEVPVFNVLKAACVNPVLHYKMKNGLLRMRDAADFIFVKDLIRFEVLATYIDGELVNENGQSFITSPNVKHINKFNIAEIAQNDITYGGTDGHEIPVIVALDGQLITKRKMVIPSIKDGLIQTEIEKDQLKIVVINRYTKSKAAVGLIKNFGLKKGAIASSVAHDSHNIIAVGTTDEEITLAINLIIGQKGGIAAVDISNENITKHLLALPIGGLMSALDGYEVARAYAVIDAFAKIELGSTLQSPFMTLSFMALLVIPEIKMSDKGIFDGIRFDLMTQSIH